MYCVKLFISLVSSRIISRIAYYCGINPEMYVSIVLSFTAQRVPHFHPCMGKEINFYTLSLRRNGLKNKNSLVAAPSAVYPFFVYSPIAGI